MIRQIEGNRLSVGELDGAETPRVKMIAELFRNAGFKSPVVSDIRSEIWLKLWGNVSFNPISAFATRPWSTFASSRRAGSWRHG